MEKQPMPDETPQEETLDPRVGKLINMVLLAEARHEAMEERLLQEPMFKDVSNFKETPQDQPRKTKLKHHRAATGSVIQSSPTQIIREHT